MMMMSALYKPTCWAGYLYCLLSETTFFV